jgi:hypothetical protein
MKFLSFEPLTALRLLLVLKASLEGEVFRDFQNPTSAGGLGENTVYLLKLLC